MLDTSKDKKSSHHHELENDRDHIESSTVKSIKLNVATTLLNRSISGLQSNKSDHQFVGNALIEKLRYEKFFCPFTRKTSSLCWHPKNQAALALGGKSGEVGFVPDINKRVVNREIENFVLLREQVGPDGELKEIKFDKINDNYFYTLTIMGEVSRWDLINITPHIIKPRVNSDVWFYSLDVDSNHKVFYVGDNKGYLNIVYPASLCPFCSSISICSIHSNPFLLLSSFFVDFFYI